MAKERQLNNRVKSFRIQRGWSQIELAQRSGISRAAVSAIEINRLVPSVAAALALATVFDCSVEELFGIGKTNQSEAEWAWPPTSVPCRYWQVKVGQRNLLYPVESTVAGVIGHDGIFRENTLTVSNEAKPEETLIMACCDPAAGLLASEFARSTGFRLLVIPRSTQQGLTLLGQGLVHVAGIHLSTDHQKDGNAQAVKDRLGEGFNLLRVARWQEGLALSPALGVRSVQAAVRSDLRWVGRESGSAARQCLDELLRDRQTPRRMARDHRGVAEAVKCGWADVGVCLRLVCEEAGLSFLTVREETYELCFSAKDQNDPRLQALIRVLRSSLYRRILGELPGYFPSDTGEVHPVR